MVQADHVLTYPDYFDVNVSEEVTMIHPDINNQTIILILEGQLYNFTQISNTTANIYITDTQEQDLNFFISVYDGTDPYTLYTSNDDTLNTNLIIADTKLYGFRYNTTENHTINETHYHTICSYVNKLVGNPTIEMYSAYSNGTEIKYSNTKTRTVINTDYEYLCNALSQTYADNITDLYEFYLVRCTNCDASNKIRLGLDTTSIKNNSVTILNKTVTTYTNITTSNYMLKTYTITKEPDEIYTGIFKFRIPFYVTINLYRDINTTFNTNFDYIYLRRYNTTTSTTYYSGLGDKFSYYLTFGLWNKLTTDTTETFWDNVNVNQANIKLYEADNYTITLLSMKTYSPTIWQYEFIKPQYTNSKVETKLTNKLEIDQEINQSYNLIMSEYEANKFGYYVNIIKWVFAVIILIGGLVVAFYTPKPIATLGAVIPIWLLVLQFMGLI